MLGRETWVGVTTCVATGVTTGVGAGVGLTTTTGTLTEFQLPSANSGPWDITTGPDGALWFSEYAGGRIGRITP